MSSTETRSAIRWALVFFGALAIAQMTILIGQVILFRLTNPSAAADPIEAVTIYARLVSWVVHPAAAILVGAFVGSLRPWSRLSIFALIWGLIPLWVSWLRPELMGFATVIQCFVYGVLGLSSLFLVGRRKAFEGREE